MAMTRYYRQLLLLSLFFVTSSGVKAAEELPLLVGFNIQFYSMNLKYPDGDVRKTKINSLLLYWDQPLNGWLDGTFTMELLDVSQDSNPIPAGQAGSGASLGVGLVFHLYQSNLLHLHTDFTYKYVDTSGSLQDQNVNMTWNQESLQLQADIRIFQYSYIYFAGGILYANGTERASGPINSSLSFNSNTPEYARFGVRIGVDPTGFIGIEVATGSIAGGQIYFQRWF